jgi:hypothetical protein
VSPELLLLLTAARVELDDDEQNLVRALLGGEIRWQWLLHLAARHGLEPLLARSLALDGQSEVPSSIAGRLATSLDGNAWRSAYLTGELHRLGRALDAANVPFIPYKGPLLAERLYGDPALRMAGDLDILVKPGDVATASDVAIGLGYERIWPIQPLSPAQRKVHTHTKYHDRFQMGRGQAQLRLEVHWAIVPRQVGFPPDWKNLWEDLESVQVRGRTWLRHSPEMLLLWLSAHGGNHCWLSARFLVDIAELLRQQPQLDWSRVIERSAQWRGARMLRLCLDLAHRLVSAPLDPEVKDWVAADETARRLADQTIDTYRRQDWLGALEEPWYHIRMLDRPGDRVRYVVAGLQPSVADWAAISLPAPLSALYYVLRPFRLLRDHAIRLLAVSRRRHWPRPGRP